MKCQVTPPCLEAALFYAHYGWPVLPVKPREKLPLTPHGVKDATTDEETIREWWAKWPEANVAVSAGECSGLFVLDIDPRHGGDESLAELVRQYRELPVTVTARTGGGGRHLYFAHPPEGLLNRTIRRGLDVKSNGGYVVAPPSEHASGNLYTWHPGRAPDEVPLADAPEWLLSMSRRPTADPRTQPDRKDTTTPADPAARARLIERAGRYLATVSPPDEGQRNNTAFSLAGHLLSFDEAGQRLTPDEVVRLMRPWAANCSPPMDPQELERTVWSASRNGTPRAIHPGAPPRPPVPEWEPFPVEALPGPVAGIVTDISAALGCDPALGAMPMLAAIGACIGNTRRIRLKRSWTEPAIIWTCCVAESGALKTPAFKAAIDPLRAIQSEMLKEHAAAMERYEAERAAHDAAKRRREETAGVPPPEPSKPIAQRIIVSDTTVEALAQILVNNPRGVLMARDELAGWVNSFDRYVSSKGGDLAHWLAMHSGEALYVDRKTSGTVHVPAAYVCITGGIQPGVLPRVISRHHREAGLLARLLLAMPPRKRKQWTEADVPPTTYETLRGLYQGLLDLKERLGADGEPQPVIVDLDDEARAAWIEFYNEHAAAGAELAGELASLHAKIEGYAARLALLVHCVRAVCGETGGLVDADSIRAGVTLARWFEREALRVYAAAALMISATSGPDPVDQRLIQWIHDQGGEVHVRDVVRGPRQYRNKPAAAKAALDALEAAGWGCWEHQAGDGRPSRVFRLKPQWRQNPPSVATKPSFLRAPEGVLSPVASVATVATHDDWGEI